MIHHANQSFQREAHRRALFGGNAYGTAWHFIARNCSAQHFKATRIGAWQQALFRAALALAQWFAIRRKKKQRSAMNCNSKQRGLPTGNSGFSGPLWLNGIALQGKASQRRANQSTSKQRGSELGNRLFSGPLWSECLSTQGTAGQRNARHRRAPNRNSKQRGSPTGNSGFSGPLWLTRPGFLGRFIN